jgi:hypothetical protein
MASGSHWVASEEAMKMRTSVAAAVLLVAFPVCAATPKSATLATARKEFNQLLTAHPNLKIFHDGMKKEAGITKNKVMRAVHGSAAAFATGATIYYGAKGQLLPAGVEGFLAALNAGYAGGHHDAVVTKTREANTKTVKEALWRAKNVSGTYTITPEQLKSWHQAGLINEIEPEAATP